MAVRNDVTAPLNVVPPVSLPTSGTTAVLLCSSDNTFDVCVPVAAAFDRHWANCPYPRFILTTTARTPWPFPGWNGLVAGKQHGWQQELRCGLLALPSQVRRVLLMLDDFLILFPVDTERVQKLITKVEDLDLQYLRLKPVERSLVAQFIRRLTPMDCIATLKDTEPYYSSLQAAIWHRDHLLELLASPVSIWDFENLRVSGRTHHAVTRAGPIEYVHVVERGKWLPYAPAAFRTAGVPFEPGTRPMWDRRYALGHLSRKVRFALIGYSVVRLKRWIKAACAAASARASLRSGPYRRRKPP